MASNRIPASVGRPAAVRAAPVGRVARGPLTYAVIVGFVAFACSMPFEAALLLGGEHGLSLSRLVGYGFFALALLRPKLSFRKPPRAFWWFSVYYAFYVLTGVYQSSAYTQEIFSTAFRLLQFLALMWISYNLFQVERAARWCLWGYGLSSIVVGILLAAGLHVEEYKGAVGRETVFGASPNTVAAMLGLGAVALIGMGYGKADVKPRTKLVCWGGFLIIATAITRTGSRGALLGLGVGLMTLVASQGSAKTRLRNTLIVLVGLCACVLLTLAVSTSADRWNRTIHEGSVAGRDRIFRSAFWMIVERPLFGWGPATNYYELGRRLGLPKRDTHNLVLWLLTEDGLLGSLPFAIGLIMTLRATLRSRRGLQGLIPLAMLATCLTVNLSGTYYVTKWFWFVVAYALASETYVPRRRSLRPVPVGAQWRRAAYIPGVAMPAPPRPIGPRPIRPRPALLGLGPVR